MDKYYKHKYMLAFYDKNDEKMLYMFDNLIQILAFQQKEINEYNLRLLRVEVYRAVRSDEHFVTFLTGEVMRLYLIDMEEKDND